MEGVLEETGGDGIKKWDDQLTKAEKTFFCQRDDQRLPKGKERQGVNGVVVDNFFEIESREYKSPAPDNFTFFSRKQERTEE